MPRILLLSVLSAISLVLVVDNPARAGDKLRIDADFPGGNIIVDKVAGDDVYVHQDLRDTAGDWFYWYFRVRGAAGRTLTFHFNKGRNPIGVRGPAVSVDGGKKWEWLGAKAVRDASFTYTFARDAAEVRFCFAFPYQASNLADFLKRHEMNPNLKVESLGKTKKGRNVELLLAGRLDGKSEQRVALTCRHHSCEMMASYALEGIIEEVLGESEEGKWLRENVEFFIVPMVDKDGVEDGDQGKNRKPRDHNRDYVGTSIHPTVHAIRERLPAWSQGKLRLAMDMHCPAARGPSNEMVYLVGGPDEKIYAEVVRFSQALEKVQKGPLVFRSRNNLAFGQGWNNPKNFVTGKPFSHWAAEFPGIRAATTIEIAYANAEGAIVTDHSARALGHDLARAMRKYLGEK